MQRGQPVCGLHIRALRIGNGRASFEIFFFLLSLLVKNLCGIGVKVIEFGAVEKVALRTGFYKERLQ
jgi:hypothetical protein